MMDKVLKLLETNPMIAAAAYMLGALVGAFLLWILISRVLLRLTKKTRTVVDDEIVAALRRPVFLSVLLIGAWLAFDRFSPKDNIRQVVYGVIVTLSIILWASAATKIAKSVLGAFARNMGEHKLIQPRTLPLFEVILKTLIVGGAIYGLLLTWDINVTAWLASAGIVGIAVGFAAKDTLANFFSGIFIMADAPYKIGDMIVLDSGERGKVTDIGIRSTRILTRDDIQIVIPNAYMGNSKIVNETAGIDKKRRLVVNVGVAYGSDIDKVRAVLIDVANKSTYLAEDPEPQVRFHQFGDSSLDFKLLGWIEDPLLLGLALDELNTSIYKSFKAANIEIPFPQRDVHLIKDN